jgi:hypothetical protein
MQTGPMNLVGLSNAGSSEGDHQVMLGGQRGQGRDATATFFS